MWVVTIRSPGGEPRQYQLRPGTNTIGRMAGNDIVILDNSASRFHAKIEYFPEEDHLIIHDLGKSLADQVLDRPVGGGPVAGQGDAV